MPRRPSKTATRAIVYGFLALAFVTYGLGINSPLLTDMYVEGSIADQIPVIRAVRARALENRASMRQLRRNYADAIRECTKTRETCPDINNPESFEQSTKTSNTDSLRGAALERSDLSPLEERILSRVLDANTCPVLLRRVMPGLFELCQALNISSQEK